MLPQSKCKMWPIAYCETIKRASEHSKDSKHSKQREHREHSEHTEQTEQTEHSKRLTISSAQEWDTKASKDNTDVFSMQTAS